MPKPQSFKPFFSRSRRNPGAPPGIEHFENVRKKPELNELAITCIDFSATETSERVLNDIDELPKHERPKWSTTRWIDVQGVHPYALRVLGETYGLHPLAIEDAMNTPQRPKLDDYDDYLFVVMRMLRFIEGKLINEQVSIFFFGDTLITVQETKGDVWDMVRQRIRKPTSRFRQYGTPYLMYALLDAIVDHIFPLLDHYIDRANKLEDRVLQDPSPAVQNEVHRLKRELSNLRQSIWPIRDVVLAIQKDECEFVPDSVETYLKDVYDHAAQANEMIEICRESANALQELLIAAASNRMNEVMKALTIMASLFLPLTFLAGVYGMNFDRIPELSWPWAYPAFWGVSILVVIGLLYYFHRRGWIGK